MDFKRTKTLSEIVKITQVLSFTLAACNILPAIFGAVGKVCIKEWHFKKTDVTVIN